MKPKYPLIQIHSNDKDSPLASVEVLGIERIMRHLLPPNFFEGDDVLYRLHQQLPIICWSTIKKPPFVISFYLCCLYRKGSYAFFHDLLDAWLIPGKILDLPLQFAADFSLPELGSQKYTAGQLKLFIEEKSDLEIIQKNLPLIEKELRSGVPSDFKAKKILELKGVSSDKKTALIQDTLVKLIKRRPQDFDYDVLSEMQHFLVLCKAEFKKTRNFHLISRLIGVQYLFRKALLLSSEVYPNKRFINLKLMRIKTEEGIPALGFVVAISFLRENERLEAKHMLCAINKLVSGVSVVKGSWFFNQGHSDNVCTFYLEIKKEDREGFSLKEIDLLKEALAKEILAHIAQSMNPIFMPQNEESVLRNILTLSKQLKFVRDLPQAIMTYHHQTDKILEFSVIVLRILKPSMRSIATYFDLKESKLLFFLDRTKIVGTLRKKHPKEATLFRLQIDKAPFLRQDHSVDLYKARESVLSALRDVIGDFRDYNGGTISKESELFKKLCAHLGETAEQDAFLLENFFYSLTPPIMRSILPPDPIQDLFLMLLSAKKRGVHAEQNPILEIKEKNKYCILLISGVNNLLAKATLKSIHGLHIHPRQFAHCLVSVGDFQYLGLIYRNPDQQTFIRLRFIIEKMITEKTQNPEVEVINYL